MRGNAVLITPAALPLQRRARSAPIYGSSWGREAACNGDFLAVILRLRHE